jgi:hypothetical protein
VITTKARAETVDWYPWPQPISYLFKVYTSHTPRRYSLLLCVGGGQ